MKARIMTVAAVLLVAVASSYWYWTTTPEYALRQIVEASQQHDVVTFVKYVDLDTLLGRLVDDVIGSVRDEPEGGEFEELGTAIAQGVATLMKPKLVEAMESAVLEFVETGSLGDSVAANEEAPSLSGLASGIGIDPSSGPSSFEIMKDGKIAIVSFQIENDDLGETMTVELLMRDEGNYWRLVQFRNFADLQASVEVKKRSLLNAANEKFRSEMLGILNLKAMTKDNHQGRYGTNKIVKVSATLENVTSEAIERCRGELWMSDRSDRKLQVLKYEVPAGFAPGESRTLTWELSVNQFITEERDLWEASAISVVHRPTQIERIGRWWVVFDNFSEMSGQMTQSYENGVASAHVGWKGGEQDGLAISWHENGQKSVEARWANGKREGVTTQWYANGEKKYETHWNRGELDDLATTWHENGQKSVEIRWVSGKREGLATSWNENGQKNIEQRWKSGEQDGIATYWYENGQKKIEQHWKGGEQDGRATAWHENGQKSAESSWKGGERDGLRAWWYKDGEKRAEGMFEQGQLVGVATFWDEDGTSAAQEVWDVEF